MSILSVSAGSGKIVIPPGGTAGQVLAKKTDTNFDVAWVDAASGGGLLNSFLHQLVIPQSSWTEADGELRATIDCEGVLPNEASQMIFVSSAHGLQRVYDEARVSCIEQGTDVLTFRAESTPTTDLLIYVTVTNATAVATDLVTWGPEMTSNTTPSIYKVSTGYLSSSNVYKLFSPSQSVSISIPFDNSESVYIQFEILNKTAMVVYGVTFTFGTITGYTNSGFEKCSIYGKNEEVLAPIKCTELKREIGASFRETVTLMFDSPTQWHGYRFGNFVWDPRDNENPLNIRQIRFILSEQEAGGLE